MKIYATNLVRFEIIAARVSFHFHSTLYSSVFSSSPIQIEKNSLAKPKPPQHETKKVPIFAFGMLQMHL